MLKEGQVTHRPEAQGGSGQARTFWAGDGCRKDSGGVRAGGPAPLIWVHLPYLVPPLYPPWAGNEGQQEATLL